MTLISQSIRGAKVPIRDVPEGLVTQVMVDRIYGVGPWIESSDN